MGKLRSNPSSVRNIVRSSAVRVGGARSLIAFPSPLVPGNNTKRNEPVFDRDGNYNYRVRDLTDLTEEEQYAGVLEVLSESPVSTAPSGQATYASPSQSTVIPPDDVQCELPSGLQHAAEDQILWHDTQGRKHIIYGKYITSNLPQAQYTFKVSDDGADRTHSENRKIVIVQEVRASADKPVRIFMYNRTETGDGKRFDTSKAIPLFFIKKVKSSPTSGTSTFIGEVFQHVFFPEVDADQRPDTVDLSYWMNEFCSDELEEDPVAEPPETGLVFTPGPGESTSQTTNQISQGGGKQTSTQLSGLANATVASPASPTIPNAAKKINCKPGTPFRGTYPNGRVVTGRTCTRKLMHTEGLDWFLESRSDGLNSMFVFLPPYVVEEFDDGPVIPIITGNHLVASDKPEGDKDNNSTRILNDDGCCGDLDDLVKVKDVATITAQELVNQLQKDKDQAFIDQQAAVTAGDADAAAQFAALVQQIQQRIDDIVANGVNTKVAAYAMLRMLCAPDPRGVQITNGTDVGMLRDPFLLHGDWLAAKTKMMFSLVGSPLDCGPGGKTGPIRFTCWQGKECAEIIEEMMSMAGPTTGEPTPSSTPITSTKPAPVITGR